MHGLGRTDSKARIFRNGYCWLVTVWISMPFNLYLCTARVILAILTYFFISTTSVNIPLFLSGVLTKT